MAKSSTKKDPDKPVSLMNLLQLPIGDPKRKKAFAALLEDLKTRKSMQSPDIEPKP